jgi:hypothetical protein
MAKVFNAAAILKKWKDRMSAPETQQNYKDGINRVNESPTALAVQDLDKTVNNFSRVIRSQRYMDLMLNYPLADWKRNAILMAGRLADGATKAANKYQAFVQRFIPVWTAMKAAAAAVGGSGIAAAKAKSAAALEVLMNAGKKFAPAA